MKAFIGLGSSLGDRRKNLERAAGSLAALSRGRIRVSPIYETPALVPENAPADWRQPYLNAAAEIEWVGSALDLLKRLKGIEREMGRHEAPRWAPRTIDLDVLVLGDKVVREDGLQVPHPEIARRSFVLDPLKDLDPLFSPSGSRENVLTQSRKLNGRAPWIMAILNLTPDSFSDGGEAQTLTEVEAKATLIEESGAHAIDIGAESTRPGATPIAAAEERRRLEPVLQLLQARREGAYFKPYLSVDTRRPATAELALNLGAECINDVGGLSDPAMLELLAGSSCDYVLMHSLSVPADTAATLPPGCDPVTEIGNWLHEKLELLDAKGVDLKRIIFDPGIGFGKTPAQSISILKRIHEFTHFPVRLLVGHSRKGFMSAFGARDRTGRDAVTLALSLRLARKGVDILRVHDFQSHIAALKADTEMLP